MDGQHSIKTSPAASIPRVLYTQPVHGRRMLPRASRARELFYIYSGILFLHFQQIIAIV